MCVKPNAKFRKFKHFYILQSNRPCFLSFHDNGDKVNMASWMSLRTCSVLMWSIVRDRISEKGPWNICGQRRSWPDCACAQSGQNLRCSLTQYRDLVEDIALVVKILTRRLATQTCLGLCHLYMPWRPPCQPPDHLEQRFVHLST